MQGQRAQRIEMLLLHEFYSRKFLLPDKLSQRDRDRIAAAQGGGEASAQTGNAASSSSICCCFSAGAVPVIRSHGGACVLLLRFTVRCSQMWGMSAFEGSSVIAIV